MINRKYCEVELSFFTISTALKNKFSQFYAAPYKCCK
jgi:hypothetical protein